MASGSDPSGRLFLLDVREVGFDAAAAVAEHDRAVSAKTFLTGGRAVGQSEIRGA